MLSYELFYFKNGRLSNCRKKKSLLTFILFFSFILLITLFSVKSHAATRTLVFDPSPDEDVLGYKLHYKLYYGQTENFEITVDLQDNTQYELPDLGKGATYYFAASAYDPYDQNGNGSDLSNVLVYTVLETDIIEIVIDNRDLSATSQTGTWGISAGSDPHGEDSVWSRDGTTFTWNFNPVHTGRYEVMMWWTEWSSRSNSVPVDIEHAGGSTKTTIDQTKKGGQWNNLGDYFFESGQSYKVTITSQPGPSSTCADAVRFVRIEEPPIADFTADSFSGQAPLTIQFADTSTGTVNDWEWDFDNNGKVDSTDQNPSYTYNTAGSYTVKLTVSGPGGSHEKTKADYINVSEPAQPPVAEFTADPVSGTAPLTVQFTDESSGDITEWAWDFNNDGTVDSTDQNPSYTYNTAGSYIVKLTVLGPGGSHQETKASYITVTEPAAQDLIIDNRDPETSYTGTWGVSGGSDPYGEDSVWSRDGTTFTWHFNPPQTSHYELMMWWTEWSSRSNSVPVDIEHAGGSTRITIDQTENGGRWNSLGDYLFESGQSYKVTITSQPGPSSTCADAVRFVVTEPAIPDLIIDNRDPETSYTGTWGVSGGSDPYGEDSVWSRDGTTFTWHFNPLQTSHYEVMMWWTEWSSRSNSVPVYIEHAGGSTRITIDQTENGGQWNSLGDYLFESGQSYKVTITSQAGPSSTCADAVRFRPVFLSSASTKVYSNSYLTDPYSTNSDNEEPDIIEREFSDKQIFEMGEALVDHRWQRVNFTDYFINPVVVAKPASLNNPDPAVIRIRNVNETGFDIRIQQWDYLDDMHGYEQISYLVIEKGSYVLPGGIMMEAGTFYADGNNFRLNTFSDTFNHKPVVIASITSKDQENAVVGRIRNVSRNGFEYYLQEQEKNRSEHGVEAVSFIACEPFSGVLNQLTIEVGTTGNEVNHNFYYLPYNETFLNVPHFLADMQTMNDGDTANVRWQDKDHYGIEIHISEEQSKDAELKHKNENVGYIIIAD